MWTADNASITADSTNVTADGGLPASLPNVDVPANRSPLQLERVHWITTRSKATASLLIVLAGAAAFTGATQVRAAAKQFFADKDEIYTAWKGSPFLIYLNSYPADVAQGFDNFEGYGPPEPPFIQAWKYPLVTVLESYAAYNPAPDLSYKPKRQADFGSVPEFNVAQRSYPRNLEFNPPPVGDLTTLLRKQPFFGPADEYPIGFRPPWYIVLFPQGPLPPPPPLPPGPVWPPPSTITNLPVRGAWEIPGKNQAIWVIGSGCFLMTATAATGRAQASFQLRRVGMLNTATTPVSIRDNGVGGTVCIVDGPSGYYYTVATQKFTQITDPNFQGADKIAFIDGWWIFNVPGTQEFYTPDSTYSLTFNGTNFALKDGATDNLVTLYENKEELWLVGAKTTEIWYDAGGQYFPFQRLVSTMIQVGCSAKNSIARFTTEGQDGLIWLALNERGQNVIVRTIGFAAIAISTPAINNAIASYTKIDDAIGYTYQEDGHEFYVLTFPSAVTPLGLGSTWVYDATTDEFHQRLSYEPYTDQWNRHRSNCFLNFQNQRLVGDYQNGSIYQMTRQAYTDNGWPLVAWRRAPYIWDGGTRERVFMASLQIEFAPGVGNTVNLGYDPQAVLQISRDSGTTFGQQIRASIGRMGNYLTRTIWRRLGFTRAAAVDVKIYDPVNRDIVGATLRKLNDD